jgi:RNA polymerase sigma-70 factor (ECF subfamily)
MQSFFEQMTYSKENQFEKLYQAHYGMVLQLCLGFLEGNKEQAKDLTQEVFILVWNHLNTFREESSAKTWIYRITVNTCLNFLKKQKSQNRRIGEALGAQGDAEQVRDAKTDPAEVLYTAMAKLSEIDRLIIGLVLDGVTQKEIAAIMGITEVNLRVRIHRIKKRLKKAMKNE